MVDLNDLSENTHEYFLNIAGFVVQASFGPAESVLMKRDFIDLFEKHYVTGGFLLDSYDGKVDYRISMVETVGVKMKKKEREKGDFFIHSACKISDNEVETYYHVGFPVIQMLFREALQYLMRNDGFMLHASGVMDSKSDILHLFLAKSGGGKSTTSLLLESEGWDHFCDDVVYVRKIKSKWVFYSPPYFEKKYPAKKLLHKGSVRLYRVHKKKNPRVDLVESTPSFLDFVLHGVWTEGGSISKKTFSMVVNLIKEFSSYELYRNLESKKLQKVLHEA